MFNSKPKDSDESEHSDILYDKEVLFAMPKITM